MDGWLLDAISSFCSCASLSRGITACMFWHRRVLLLWCRRCRCCPVVGWEEGSGGLVTSGLMNTLRTPEVATRGLPKPSSTGHISVSSSCALNYDDLWPIRSDQRVRSFTCACFIMLEHLVILLAIDLTCCSQKKQIYTHIQSNLPTAADRIVADVHRSHETGRPNHVGRTTRFDQ